MEGMTLFANILPMPPVKVVRVGIAGTGRIVPAHIEAIRDVGGEVVAIAGSDWRRASEVAARHRGTRGCSVAEIVSDPEIDVVHVAGRNVDHVPIALAAAAAGKHVVVEKPLAFTARESARIESEVAAAGLCGMTCFTYLGHGAVAAARELVAAGEVGPVVLVRGHYLQDWLALESDDDWRCDPDLNGPSRALADIGTHWFALLEHITGQEVVAVRAEMERPVRRAVTAARPSEPGGDDLAVVSLRLEGGAIASCVVSQLSHGHRNDILIEVTGRSGSVSWSSEWPGELATAARSGADRVRDVQVVGEDRLPLAALLENFYAAVTGATSPGWYPPLSLGVRAAAFVDASLQSAVSGEWVSLAP